MSSNGRYPTDPNDLITTIDKLRRRIHKLERNPRVGDTAIDRGNLVVNGGDIIIRNNDGIDVIRMFQDNPPEIRFAPIGADSDHVASLYAQDETINSTDQTAGYFQIRTLPGLTADGGYVKIYKDGATLGHIDAGSGDEGSYNTGVINGTTGALRIVGRWLNLVQVSASDALFTGTIATGVANSATLNYTTPFATTIVPVIGFVSTAGAIAWSITAQSTSSFTVAWGGAAAAKVLNMWNVRL